MKTTDLPKVSNLTDEQLNTLIAEECVSQFQCARCDDPAGVIKYGAFFCCDSCAERASEFTLEAGLEMMPRYTESLDAMHEAEKTLDTGEIEEYMDVLPLCAGSDLVPKGTASFVAYFATAKQRAQAFVVAKGKADL